ncbi:hypothetical protein GCM10009799_45130 [Nocardiopsis rhodophaea]|uniref:DUF6292 domain-containing protein n=1 Tax=Nocardiopsis rhodophaea TaxID=280238 RepID=A0ABP5F3N2_9ACTN
MTDYGPPPIPVPYSPEWVRLPEPYVQAIAHELTSRDVEVVDHWNDPMDPRDATVIVRARGGGRLRFVWDEESGWRQGPMDANGWVPLHLTRYLRAGLLPAPTLVADLVEKVLDGNHEGVVERPRYRSFRDYGDALDGRLAEYAQGREPAG